MSGLSDRPNHSNCFRLPHSAASRDHVGWHPVLRRPHLCGPLRLPPRVADADGRRSGGRSDEGGSERVAHLCRGGGQGGPSHRARSRWANIPVRRQVYISPRRGLGGTAQVTRAPPFPPSWQRGNPAPSGSWGADMSLLRPAHVRRGRGCLGFGGGGLVADQRCRGKEVTRRSCSVGTSEVPKRRSASEEGGEDLRAGAWEGAASGGGGKD